MYLDVDCLPPPPSSSSSRVLYPACTQVAHVDIPGGILNRFAPYNYYGQGKGCTVADMIKQEPSHHQSRERQPGGFFIQERMMIMMMIILIIVMMTVIRKMVMIILMMMKIMRIRLLVGLMIPINSYSYSIPSQVFESLDAENILNCLSILITSLVIEELLLLLACTGRWCLDQVIITFVIHHIAN